MNEKLINKVLEITKKELTEHLVHQSTSRSNLLNTIVNFLITKLKEKKKFEEIRKEINEKYWDRFNSYFRLQVIIFIIICLLLWPTFYYTFTLPSWTIAPIIITFVIIAILGMARIGSYVKEKQDIEYLMEVLNIKIATAIMEFENDPNN